jgi:hypothetical protein
MNRITNRILGMLIAAVGDLTHTTEGTVEDMSARIAYSERILELCDEMKQAADAEAKGLAIPDNLQKYQ